ncbi:MAG TPA: hypothetical protein VL131_15680 [Gammaproteobacteria bacterium]|nr:hypothetical protein [Gammaproteobacteria bacterium]
MSDWVDFGVYAIFMATFWFVGGTAFLRWPLILLADRNPEWLAAHPQDARALRGNPWHIAGAYALGVLSLAVLTSFQLGFLPVAASHDEARWSALWGITMLTSLVGLVYFIAGGTWLAARWKRRVPPPERREALLMRRSIDDFIPRRWRLAVYAVVAAHAASWLLVGLFKIEATAPYWATFFNVAVLSATFSGVFTFIARTSVHRPPHALDRVFGPRYRRDEVRMSFFPQLLPPVVGTVALYQETVGATFIDFTRGMYLSLLSLTTLACWHALARPSSGSRPTSAPPVAEKLSPS